MFPKGLYSKYEQYKRDTVAVTQWLATTAISLGFKKGDDVEPSQSYQYNGGLKGKARVEAKKAAAAQRSTIMVKVHMLVPMAEHVASKAKTVADCLKLSLEQATERRAKFAIAYKSRQWLKVESTTAGRIHTSSFFRVPGPMSSKFVKDPAHSQVYYSALGSPDNAPTTQTSSRHAQVQIIRRTMREASMLRALRQFIGLRAGSSEKL